MHGRVGCAAQGTRLVAPVFWGCTEGTGGLFVVPKATFAARTPAGEEQLAVGCIAALAGFFPLDGLLWLNAGLFFADSAEARRKTWG